MSEMSENTSASSPNSANEQRRKTLLLGLAGVVGASALAAGATGYLLKDTPPHELAEAIRRAARGETVLAAGMASRLHARRTLPTHSDLTSREIEVLQLVAQGLSNAEVGGRLFIGEATVKTHLVRIFGKLGVTDRTAAVTTAYGVGLLPLP